MKIFQTTLLFFSLAVLHAQSKQETENIATLCKVWGFLKYYHPEVAKGKMDWDKEFMTRVKMVSVFTTKEETSKFYLDWIESLGEVKICKKCDNDVPDSLKFNFDLRFIEDTTNFSVELIKKLHYIQYNRNQKENYYLYGLFNKNRKDHEKPYLDSIFPSAELRLLGLSRYWNIIQYFFPYKYVNGSDWNEVLPEMIPKFKYSTDTISYHLAMMELTAKVNDSHAYFNSKYIGQFFGIYYAAFEFKIIDNKAVVIGFYNDTLCGIDDIKIGDVILKVNNESIESIINRNSKYIAASNEPTRLRNLVFTIFNGNSNSINITFERNGDIHEKNIKRFLSKDFHYDSKKELEKLGDTCEILAGNIGYVNMGLLEKNDVNSTMKKMMNTKSIIFDVRNYPNETIDEVMFYLNEKEKPFVKFTFVDLKYPGVFRPVVRPGVCGKENKNYFKGKVIVLINEETQSAAEFTVMSLQTAPKVTCIGSQTAGADGNISILTFPGGYHTWMTGHGIYYPDGRETQRIGIVPDIEVKPTIEGIRAHRDEVLEKAIEVANEK